MQETREMRLHVEGVHGALHVGRGLFRRRFVVGGMSGTDTLPFVINMYVCCNVKKIGWLAARFGC